MTRANLNKARYTDAKTVDYYNTAYGFLPCEAYVFDKFIQQKDCILDLGVGGGRTTAFLSNKGGKYIGIDFSQPMIDVCCKKFPGLEFYCEDASDLRRFDDGTFDVVVFSFNGICGLPTNEARAQCLREVKRVLRPGGRFIFSSDNARFTNLWPVGHTEAGRPDRTATTTDEKKTFVQRLKLPAIAKRLADAGRALTGRRFYRGSGYVYKALHGGLWTFQATPTRWKEELRLRGFDTEAVVSSLYPKESSVFLTPWYYYVALRQ
jgi:SAM-dependent methyltransferase